MTLYVEGLMSLILGFLKFLVLASGSMPFILSFLNCAIHIERSELHLGRAMKENNEDHV